MENKDLLDGKIGAIGDYELDFKDGKLVGVVKVAFTDPSAIVSLSGDVNLAVSGASLIRALEKSIGGPLPQFVGEFLINTVGLK